MIFGMGRIPAIDERDQAYTLRTADNVELRTQRWTPGWVGDQGNTPQCVGYGWAHWLGSDPIRQFLDPTGLYKIAQFHEDRMPGRQANSMRVRPGRFYQDRYSPAHQRFWRSNTSLVAGVGRNIQRTERRVRMDAGHKASGITIRTWSNSNECE